MQPIKDIFGEYKIPPKKRTSERGILIEYFANKLNETRDGKKYKYLSAKSVNYFVQHLKVKDLYYLKSICDDGERRNQPFSKVFFGSLK